MAEQAFQALQHALAAHLRDPKRNAAPAGIEERRLKIYRDLLYNTVEDTLASAFPVMRRLSEEADWHRRVRHFYATHRSQEPQLHMLAEQFLRYLESRESQPHDPPFLGELAHYEWVELALSVSTAKIPESKATATEDSLNAQCQLSPLAWPLVYEWPVHRIGPDFLPDQPPAQPTCLVVYRNREDAVRFMEVNAVTARLLELMQDGGPATGRALLERLAAELGHPQPEVVVTSGAEILADLRQRDIVVLV